MLELKIPSDNPSALKRIGAALSEMGQDIINADPSYSYLNTVTEQVKTTVIEQVGEVSVTTVTEPVKTDTPSVEDERFYLVDKTTGVKRSYDNENIRDNLVRADETLAATTRDEVFYFHGADQQTAETIKTDDIDELKTWLKDGELRVQCNQETFEQLQKPYEQLSVDVSTPPPPPPVSSHLDSEGMPWDGRIHSKNKTTIKNGKWKCRKCPKEMSGDEWAVFVNEVREECKQALSGEPIVETKADDIPPPPIVKIGDIPPPPGYKTDDIPPPPVVKIGDIPPPPGYKADDIPPPPVVKIGDIPPPPVVKIGDIPPPPGYKADDIPPPPAPEMTDDNIKFADLMLLITGNSQNGSLAKINAILQSNGVAKLPLLSSARPDLIPEVYNQLKLELGV